MYHYQKNIGDYRSATMHLSLVEHGVYNQLLDWYYLDEKPLPLDNRTLFRRLSARTEEEQGAVTDVLAEMFQETPEGWRHKRVERELAAYRAKAQQAREAGKLGGRPRKKVVGSGENRSGSSHNRSGSAIKADAKPTINQEPLTKNQPEAKSKSKGAKAPAAARQVVEIPDWIPAEAWLGFAEMRCKGRHPLTKRAAELIVIELAKLKAQGHDPGRVLDQSTAAGWRGVFPIRQDTGATSSGRKLSLVERAAQHERDANARRAAQQAMGQDDGDIRPSMGDRLR